MSENHYEVLPSTIGDNRKGAVFSLSMPVKGGIEYLPLAFSSATLQGGLVELALLDASGGDVRVRALAEKYAPLISYRYHRNGDGGQSAAIQEGWDNTSGMFVGWLNSDDYLLPGALAKVKAVFDSHPGIDVVYGHAIYVDENGDFKQYFPAISKNISDIYYGCVICQPACFVRRTAINRVGGLDLSLHYTMDWDLWIRLHKSGCKFHMIDEPLAIVCDHIDSKTNSGTGERFREIDKCLDKNKDLKRRIIAKLGFKVYSLLYKATPFSLFVANAIRKLTQLITPAPRLSPLFGLEPYSNLIRNRCRITMFAAAPVSHVSLVVDCPGDYYICDGKERRPLKFVGPKEIRTFGFNGKAVLYTAEVSPVPAGRLDYTIESYNRSTRLLAFSLHRQ
jgi:Glycosyl transferase family 2